jgi:hypothetical protein
MTMTRRARFLTITGLAATLVAGAGGTALAATSGGHQDHGEKVKAHCVTVYLTGDTKADVSKFEKQDHGKPGYGAQGDRNRKVIETYSASATAQVCEDRHGKITVTIDPATIAAAETEAQHGGH